MSASADFVLQLTGAQVNTASSELVTPSSNIRYRENIKYTNGVGANKIEQFFSDQRTLTASATENIDLAGVLTDVYGNTITLTKLKGIIIKAATGNTNNVQITRDATNGLPLFMAAGDGIELRPGELFCWMSPDANGVAVTAGTGDLLVATNSAGGTSVTYDIIILGETT